MNRSPKKGRLPRNLLDAVYRTVHDFGAENLAQLTGTSAGVIDNKANPNATTPHLPTLADGLIWQALTKDYRILHAMAQALGHVAIPLPDMSCISDQALLEHLTKIGREGGDFHRMLGKALSDKRFRADEVTKIEREAYEWIAAIHETCGRIRGLVDA